MEKDGADAEEFPYYCSAKVHRPICVQLIKLVDRIAKIFTAIESARPRSKNGIPVLCMLQVSMDRAKSLIQHCSECSKIYLAITGEKILSRCEKIRGTLESCLSQIQNMVPLLLAAKISGIIQDLGNAKFHLDSADREAGKIVLSLMHQDIKATSTVNSKELEALQLAASKLNITSPLAVLIEKHCVKRLLGKLGDTIPRKKKVLKYLLYLLNKYSNEIWQCESNIGAFTRPEESRYELMNDCGSPEAPEEFKCPISTRLMYDPSIIASGKTFERVWIERWFGEGNDTCPVTHTKLDHLSVTPNSAMKSLIAKWCLKHQITILNPCVLSDPTLLSRSTTSCSSSVASFCSNMDRLHLQVSNVSIYSSSNSCGSDLSAKYDEEFKNSQSSEKSLHCPRNVLGYLSSLADLSWECQCKVVEDAKYQLEGNDQAHLSSSSYNYVNTLIKFMKEASKFCDVKAQRNGADVLFAILSYNRNELPRFQGDTIYLLASFLDSEITGKALAILEILSYEQYCMSLMLASGVLPSILKVLETPIIEHHALSMKILCNLSINSDIGYHMLYLDYIPILVRFLGDSFLARHSIEIIKNLCSIEEARNAVCDNTECVAAIGKLLKSRDEQEHAMDVLLSLCHSDDEYCELVMTENIVESLVLLSVNGNSRVKLIALELLQLIGHNRPGNGSKPRNARLDIDSLCNSKAKKSSSKTFRLFGREVSRFAKSR